MTLAELGLTPAQLAEVQELSEELVSAWLEAAMSAHGLRSPAGWFLAGVRSGTLPGAVPDNERLQRARLAEIWVRNAGLFEPDEPSLVDALFGERGRLRAFVADDVLVARMLALWRSLQPVARQVEREQLERAERWKAMHGLGIERTSDAHPPQTAQPSHSSVPLTRVSAPLAAVGADADIAW